MDDWEFCQESLQQVSRTFARPIEMLREPLLQAVTCGYLLCRVADTVEDTASLPLQDKDALFATLLTTIDASTPPETFANAFARSRTGEGADAELCRNLPRVMRVVRELPAPHQQILAQWVGEMTRGMGIYSHRRPREGVVNLLTLSDLERYCYFVAGTVGHMLTSLFAETLSLDAETSDALRTTAEDFGLGLQLVNILKDLTDDWARGWCFVPQTLCAAEDLTPGMLFEPTHRQAAHRAIAPMFARADQALEQAFEYCLSLPHDATDIRLFCLLPLWMAVATLQHARGNDAQLETGTPVKITRAEVEWLIQDCVKRVGDNASLRSGMQDLLAGQWRQAHGATPKQSASA